VNDFNVSGVANERAVAADLPDPPLATGRVTVAILAVPAALGAAIAVDADSALVATGLLVGLPVVDGVAPLLPIGLAVRAARWHVVPDGIGGPNN
jgi:hypothetical protein